MTFHHKTPPVLAPKEYSLDTRSLIYDATNYFTFIDTDTPGRLARRGHNKARRIDLRQVSLALGVSREFHVPLLHEVYPGHRPDSREFPRILRMLRGPYRELFTPPPEVTLVFDKGNNSQENLGGGVRGQYGFITSLPPTQHPKLLEAPLREFTRMEGDRLKPSGIDSSWTVGVP